jgi:hypothetical protein
MRDKEQAAPLNRGRHAEGKLSCWVNGKGRELLLWVLLLGFRVMRV